ncbi:dTDP-4-dehydrorhamnose 3,5-epimerase [Nitratireductor sp. GISD-1A_MAKvit]|uniref:dTDP-4-dehydrorhamnose 3,5-epimerase n=1 Tax=Nitratireductor sp. GISD-1A_MAKvit TaxID=3234198 RepID=UPI00346626E6
MMEVRPLGLEGVFEITPEKFGDERGYFSETYNQEKLAAHGIDLVFVQDNQSYSARKGVLRGLHYQLPPRAQDKLVRVLKGRIFDVAVDIRRDSATFGQWVGVELSEERWNQLLVPKGFAHGFVTLEEHTAHRGDALCCTARHAAAAGGLSRHRRLGLFPETAGYCRGLGNGHRRNPRWCHRPDHRATRAAVRTGLPH